MEHRYPGKEPSNAEQEQTTHQETLASLGDNFNICWDAWEESGRSTENLPPAFLNKDKKTFNEKAFLESAAKLNPTYLQYLQRLIQEGMDNLTTKQEKQKNITSEQRNKEMSDLTISFITKLEFFSRLNSPEQITSGGKTAKQLEAELNRANIQISPYAQQMLRNKKEFITSKESEQIDLVRLKVKDLFPNAKENPTTDDLYQKAEELGLELCPAEVGPAYRLAYQEKGELKKDQPMGEWIRIAMKQIPDPDRDPSVFDLVRGAGGVWLSSGWTGPTGRWPPTGEFVFRLQSVVLASNT